MIQPGTLTDWKTTMRKKMATYFNHDASDGADVAVGGDRDDDVEACCFGS
jgi:hypothetical protein